MPMVEKRMGGVEGAPDLGSMVLQFSLVQL